MTHPWLEEHECQSRPTKYCHSRKLFSFCLLWRSAFSLPVACALEWQGRHFFEYALHSWKPGRSSTSYELGWLILHGGGRSQVWSVQDIPILAEKNITQTSGSGKKIHTPRTNHIYLDVSPAPLVKILELSRRGGASTPFNSIIIRSVWAHTFCYRRHKDLTKARVSWRVSTGLLQHLKTSKCEIAIGRWKSARVSWRVSTGLRQFSIYQNVELPKVSGQGCKHFWKKIENVLEQLLAEIFKNYFEKILKWRSVGSNGPRQAFVLSIVCQLLAQSVCPVSSLTSLACFVSSFTSLSYKW